jgi:hypothetical protein
LCFVCDENWHTSETKHKFNKNISFIYYTTIWQILLRLSTNFTDNPRMCVYFTSILVPASGNICCSLCKFCMLRRCAVTSTINVIHFYRVHKIFIKEWVNHVSFIIDSLIKKKMTVHTSRWVDLSHTVFWYNVVCLLVWLLFDESCAEFSSCTVLLSWMPVTPARLSLYKQAQLRFLLTFWIQLFCRNSSLYVLFLFHYWMSACI